VRQEQDVPLGQDNGNGGSHGNGQGQGSGEQGNNGHGHNGSGNGGTGNNGGNGNGKGKSGSLFIKPFTPLFPSANADLTAAFWPNPLGFASYRDVRSDTDGNEGSASGQGCWGILGQYFVDQQVLKAGMLNLPTIAKISALQFQREIETVWKRTIGHGDSAAADVAEAIDGQVDGRPKELSLFEGPLTWDVP
jgi:hypothetical protein